MVRVQSPMLLNDDHWFRLEHFCTRKKHFYTSKKLYHLDFYYTTCNLRTQLSPVYMDVAFLLDSVKRNREKCKKHLLGTVHLHTAINKADYVSWRMLYMYEGNNMHSWLVRKWCCTFMGEPLNHIHQDTKSAWLIAVCKRSLKYTVYTKVTQIVVFKHQWPESIIANMKN